MRWGIVLHANEKYCCFLLDVVVYQVKHSTCGETFNGIQTRDVDYMLRWIVSMNKTLVYDARGLQS